MGITYQSSNKLMMNEFRITTHPETGVVIHISHHNSHGGQVAARKLGEKLTGCEIPVIGTIHDQTAHEWIESVGNRVANLEKDLVTVLNRLFATTRAVDNQAVTLGDIQAKNDSLEKKIEENRSNTDDFFTEVRRVASRITHVEDDLKERPDYKWMSDLEDRIKAIEAIQTEVVFSNPTGVTQEPANPDQLDYHPSVMPNRITLEQNYNGTWSAAYDTGMTPIAKKLLDFLTRLRN